MTYHNRRKWTIFSMFLICWTMIILVQGLLIGGILVFGRNHDTGYFPIGIALVLNFIIGGACLYFVVYKLTNSLEDLRKYISRARTEEDFFQKSDILEVDSLYKAVEDLLEDGRRTRKIPYEHGAGFPLVPLALGLFGKGDNLREQMGLLLEKIGEHYGARKVSVRIIHSDFHSMYTEYQWCKEWTEEDRDKVSSYCETDWEMFSGRLERQGYILWDPEGETNQAVREFCGAENGNQGCCIPLYDNGCIMGILTVEDQGEAGWNDQEEIKNLHEVGRVIQSQINRQRYDLAGKAKSDFLSRISHEIRTPMNGIIGMTAIARQKDQKPERIQECLQKIQTSSDYLMGLINDILDMSKLESGKMQLEPVEFTIEELAASLDPLISSQAEKKGIIFRQHIQTKHQWFMADQMKISQVLIHLLENAVKFTQPGGKITLTIREEREMEKGGEVFFSVCDTGIGITKEDQKRIFCSFEQTKDTEVSSQRGMGLGLSISSRLVQMMGSRIRLESQPGKGSNFSFTLKMPYGSLQETKNRREPHFQGYRVLVVEDNELNAEIAQSILEDYQFQVDCVYDGAQAVERMEETSPGTYDLILMDIMMPVMDGLEATRKIRSMDREDCRKIPIIAMSANAFDDDLQRSVECGMNGHLEKPVEIEKMYQLLCHVLK